VRFFFQGEKELVNQKQVRLAFCKATDHDEGPRQRTNESEGILFSLDAIPEFPDSPPVLTARKSINIESLDILDNSPEITVSNDDNC
jgi:hypothetical protein